MRTADPRDELDSLLKEQPSELRFRALRAILANWPASEGRDQALGWAAESIAFWPDSTRCVGSEWLSAVEAGGFEDTWVLIRSLNLRLFYRWDPPPSPEVGGPRIAMAIAASPHAAPITELNLRARAIGDEGLAFLINSPYLKSVHSLSLAFNRISGQGLALLLSSPLLEQLDTLDLRGNFLNAEDVARLLESPRSRRITRLGLGGNEQIDGLDQVQALSKSVRGRGLVGLKISWPTNPDADRGVAKALESLDCERLEGLSLDAAPEQDSCSASGTIKSLARGAGFRRLKDLRIHGLRLEDDDAKYLAGARFRLRRLSLWPTEISRRGAVMLADSDVLSELDAVTIQIEAEGCEVIASSELMNRLFYLSVSGRGLSSQAYDSSAHALATGESRLIELDMRVPLTSQGVEVLAKARSLSTVRMLRLPMRFEESAESLRHSVFTNVERLSVEVPVANFFPIVASSPCFANLRELNIPIHFLNSDEIAKTLASSSHLDGLVGLDFRGRCVREDGVSDEGLSFEGADALEGAAFLSRLDTLKVMCSAGVKEQLTASPKLRQEARYSL